MSKEKQQKQGATKKAGKAATKTTAHAKKHKQSPLLLIFLALGLIAMAALFISAALILFIGMLPTLVFFLANRHNSAHIRALTIGAMNFAGCFPFLIDLAQNNYTLEKAGQIILDPFSLVTMFSAATIGYAIDWAVSGIASKLLYQKSLARRKTIKKQQEDLVEQWGPYVTGEQQLDDQGFPVNM